MDKKLIILLFIFFAFFSFFSLTIISQKSGGFLTRAAEENEPSVEKSLILAWPLRVDLKRPTDVKITVFIMNNKGVPLVNKKVTLKSNIGSFKENNLMTDKLGKAEFYFVHENPGIANIEAIANDNIVLNSKISIKFE